MRKHGRYLSVLFLTALVLSVFSCTSMQLSPDSLNDPNLATCSGNKARKVFDFTVSTYMKMPVGLPVARVSEYMEFTSSGSEFRAQNLVKELLYNAFTIKNGEVVHEGDDALSRVFKRYKSGDSILVRTGPFNFVLASKDACNNLVDPVSNNKIITRTGECTDDPNYFGKPGYARHNEALESFVKETGFRGWDVTGKDVYCSVPERERDAVCKEAGLDKNCFEIPTEKALETYADSDSYVEYPFTGEFVFHNCPNCGNGYASLFVKWLRSDPNLRLQRESAFAKDLFLRASTQITKKIQGHWVIYRIHWDPSLFCKYAKPTSDLYTH